MKITIVGGAGFIGSHFAERLYKESNEIHIIDNLSSGSISHIQGILSSPNVHFHLIDALNTAALVKIFDNSNTVIHLASNPDISKAVNYPRIDFEQGTLITESVLEAIRISGVKNIIYSSGSGVYKVDQFIPINENSLLQPISTYGASKLAGESLISAYSHMFELNALTFRFANVVGPRQTHGVGYDFIRKLNANSRYLEILGNGTQTKSYVHVSDVISAILLANSMFVEGYEVFNVATQDTISVLEIASMAISVMGLNKNDVEIKLGEDDRGWKGDTPKILLDTQKIKSLGWKNKFSSADAMLDAMVAMKNEILNY